MYLCIFVIQKFVKYIKTQVGEKKVSNRISYGIGNTRPRKVFDSADLSERCTFCMVSTELCIFVDVFDDYIKAYLERDVFKSFQVTQGRPGTASEEDPPVVF